MKVVRTIKGKLVISSFTYREVHLLPSFILDDLIVKEHLSLSKNVIIILLTTGHILLVVRDVSDSYLHYLISNMRVGYLIEILEKDASIFSYRGGRPPLNITPLGKCIILQLSIEEQVTLFV